ncbi:MAG TPA: hypothetical protein DF699_03130, partial [Phycisphaerales bacterium]|nr:hypothetical protein [Phycisphaerales bacterium]
MSKEHKPPLLGSEFYNRVEEITGLSGLHFLALKKEKITTVGGLEDVIFKQLQWEVSHQLSPDYDRHVSHLQQLNSYLKGVLSEPIVVSEIDTDIESLLRSKSSTWHRAYGKLRNLDGRLPA